MNKEELKAFFDQNQTIIADGATGTNLIARGLPPGTTAEHWVLEKPDEILKLHSDFIKNGAHIILTSTFGGSKIRLAHAGIEGDFEKVNSSGAKIAKNAAKGTNTLVAGSMGPLGEMIKPLGTLAYDEALQLYADQSRILVDAGADLIVIETQFDINEAKAAIEGVRSVSEIGLVCSFSFDRGVKTMMGVSPTKFADGVKEYDLSAVGINCGKSILDNQQCLEELFSITDLPIWFKPNAGLPEVNESGTAVYSLSPQEMGDFASNWPTMGAKIIGGCCGTSPAHLYEIAQAVR